MEHIERTEDTFIIRDLETLRVFADPLRSQIYEILIRNPLTVKQVADRLGLAPSKLYYHFSLLEKHGLVRVVDTRMHANLVEKVYQAAASYLDVDRSLLNFSSESGKENISTVAVATIDTTRDDLLRSFEARAFELEQGAEEHPRRAIINRTLSRIPDDAAEKFQDRLGALIEEFAQAEVTDPEAASGLLNYALTVVFYPSFYYQEEGEERAARSGESGENPTPGFPA